MSASTRKLREKSRGVKIFRRQPRIKEKVTLGRFEMERGGEVAYLEYSMAGNVLTLIHTEVPAKLRGKGLASALAEAALQVCGSA